MKVRYDDFWILTCLRRRIELPFAAPLPLGETFGLVEHWIEGLRKAGLEIPALKKEDQK